MADTRTEGREGVRDETAVGRDGQKPDKPTELDKGGIWGAIKRSVSEFKEDNLTDWAAALTYYGILAIFPAILALVSLLGLMGTGTTQTLIDNLGQVAPGPAKDIFTSAIENLQKNQGAAGIMVIVGLALAIWSASGYVAAFMRASNAIYEVEEGRPIWKSLPTRVGTTLILLVLLALTAIGVVLSGGVAEQVGKLLGLDKAVIDVWNIAKWPVLLVLVSLMFAILYYAAPNVKHPKFNWVSPGGVVAVVLWLLASAAFAFYVANFASYNKTYGSLGGVIVFLTWLWISNIAVLFGAELNAELERSRQIKGGMPEDKEPFLPHRDTKKLEKD
jgi:membrane protein